MKKLLYLIFFITVISVLPAHAAEIIRYVNTDNTCSGDEDGTTNETDGSPDSAYCDLATWDSNEANDLVSAGNTHKVIVSGTAADNTHPVIGTDWTTGSSNCLTITTDSGVPNSRHQGTFPTGTYRIVNSEYFESIQLETACVHIKGLAIRNTANDDARGTCVRAINGVTTELHIENTICHYSPSGTPTTSSANTAFSVEGSVANRTVVFANNLIYGQENTGINIGTTSTGGTTIVYNNTVADIGSNGITGDLGGTTDTYQLKNNICQKRSGGPDCYNVTGTADTDGSTTNLSEDSSSHGTSPVTSAVVLFVNEGSDDYHLSASDVSGALSGATDLSGDGDFPFTADFEGNTRSDWDIGADEEGGAGGGPPPPPTIEICGDGIDNDAVGGDLLCPAPDKDRDGFEVSVDCDDTDRYVYPGVYVDTGCGDGYKLCQNDGSFTSCTLNSVTPLCEATGGGNCYYIDPSGGNDANDGSYANPWLTTANITYYQGSGDPTPPGHITIGAGDVVYFRDGTHNTFIESSAGQDRIFSIRTNSGTAANHIKIKHYPDSGKATLDMSACTQGGNNCVAIGLLQTAFVDIEGLEVTGGCNGCEGSAVSAAESNDITIFNMEIHDWNANDNNNPAGISGTGVDNFTIHHNQIYDNYDRLNGDTGGQKTENSANVTFFGGDNHIFHHNVVYNTVSVSNALGGTCWKYKHGSSTGAADVYENVFYNCSFYAMGSGTPNTSLHHNFVLNSSSAVAFRDFGGPTFNVNNTVEYNTFVNSKGTTWGLSDTYTPIGSHIYRFNILEDNAATYASQDVGMHNINTYSSDAQYVAVVQGGLLTFDANCYYNTNGQSFNADLWAAGGGFGPLGGQYTLTEWQTDDDFQYDLLSQDIDPILDVYYLPAEPTCKGFGWNPVQPSDTPEGFLNIRARQIPRRR